MSGRPNIQTLLERAITLHQAGRTGEAESLYNEVLTYAPQDANALNLKGIIQADAGHHAEALTLYDAAIEAGGGAEPCFNKGLSLTAVGRAEDALAVYAQAIAINPAHADTWLNTGLLLAQLDRPRESRDAFEAMTGHCPKDARGFYNLAICQMRDAQLDDASKSAGQACLLNPNWPEALGLAAEIAFSRTVFDEAYDFAQRALALDPALFTAHRVMGDVLIRRMEYNEARAHYEQALAHTPITRSIYANYAVALERMGLLNEAEIAYKKALSLQPDNPETRCGLALTLLGQGKLREGWPFYAWRPISKNEKPAPEYRPLANQPPAAGEPLRLLGEQALGEQVMFANLLPDLLKITRDIEMRCDPRLVSLLQRSFPDVRFKADTGEREVVSGALGDALRWLRPDFPSFPRHAGYLRIDTNLRAALRARYTRDDLPLIGISWASTSQVKIANAKSIPLGEWNDVLTKRAIFVSLQYGEAAREVQKAPAPHGVELVFDNTIDPDHDIDRLAAQIAAMDIVITTSNTTAHIAGALNVPTLVLAPIGFGALWHWFQDRHDSPWYPSVRILRQSRRGLWRDVLEQAARFLDAFIAERSPRGVK